MSYRVKNGKLQKTAAAVDAWNAQNVTAMNVEIIDNVGVAANAGRRFIKHWIAEGEQAVCLTCKHEWRGRDVDEPPALLVIISSVKAEHKLGMVSAICKECAKRPDTRARILAKLNLLWPNIGFAPMPEPGHA